MRDLNKYAVMPLVLPEISFAKVDKELKVIFEAFVYNKLRVYSRLMTLCSEDIDVSFSKLPVSPIHAEDVSIFFRVV